MPVAPNGFLLCTDYGRQVLYHGHRLEESRICPIAERSTTPPRRCSGELSNPISDVDTYTANHVAGLR